MGHDKILMQSHFLSDAFFDIAVSFEKYLIFYNFLPAVGWEKVYGKIYF
ncbi:MAG: hypothetical protein LBR79_01430 [Oscillospiraceae bacterium]|nr:hypothetical protein [Oscillospiraceae bacterium]